MYNMCSEGEEKVGDELNGNHIFNLKVRQKRRDISTVLFMCKIRYFTAKKRRR